MDGKEETEGGYQTKISGDSSRGREPHVRDGRLRPPASFHSLGARVSVGYFRAATSFDRYAAGSLRGLERRKQFVNVGEMKIY